MPHIFCIQMFCIIDSFFRKLTSLRFELCVKQGLSRTGRINIKFVQQKHTFSSKFCEKYGPRNVHQMAEYNLKFIYKYSKCAVRLRQHLVDKYNGPKRKNKLQPWRRFSKSWDTLSLEQYSDTVMLSRREKSVTANKRVAYSNRFIQVNSSR
jgi:hypothetical protein